MRQLLTSLRKGSVWSVVVIATRLLVACQAGWSQAIGGSISGSVTDKTGGAVPDAKVTTLNPDTGVRQTTFTNEEGFYAFPSLPVGHYEIHVERSGFEPVKRTGLVIDIGTRLRIDFALAISTQRGGTRRCGRGFASPDSGNRNGRNDRVCQNRNHAAQWPQQYRHAESSGWSRAGEHAAS